MKEHHKYLVNKGKNINLSNISIETIEEIRKNTIAKEQSDQIYLFKAYIIFAICLLGLFFIWAYFVINYSSEYLNDMLSEEK